jgi:hypothetical protein
MKHTRLLLLCISMISIEVTAEDGAAIIELESRILSGLICNSLTGAAISEVSVSTVTDTSTVNIVKVSGTYKQDKPFTGQLKMFSGNAFATVTGQFQLFLDTNDNSIKKAKFKIGLRKGYLKASCLINKTDDFDF